MNVAARQLSPAAAAAVRAGIRRADIRKELAERHLGDFIRQAWHVIQPNRPLVWGWHLDAIAEHLEAVERGQIRKLVISVPFRMTKSVSVSVMFAPWAWLRDPTYRWLYITHDQKLSIRDSVACRRVIESDWYAERWGDRFVLTSDQNEKARFENDKRGERLAKSTGSAVTGEGGDFIIVDDAHDANDARSQTVPALLDVGEWYREVASQRADDPKTVRRVICGQRIHPQDLTGQVLVEQGWEELRLPMRWEEKLRKSTSIGFVDPRANDGDLLCAERFGEAEVDDAERTLGSVAARAQLQQDPSARQGTLFKREWVRRAPAIPGGDVLAARGWDFAGTKPTPANRDPDFTVGLRVVLHRGEGRFYVAPDVIRMREEPGDVENALLAAASADGRSCRVGIYKDPAQAGKYQAAVFAGKLATLVKDVAIVPAVNLHELFAPIRAQAQVGNVIFVGDPEDPRDPLKPVIDEICGFDLAPHDDVVAAIGAAYYALTQYEPKVEKPVPRARALTRPLR